MPTLISNKAFSKLLPSGGIGKYLLYGFAPLSPFADALSVGDTLADGIRAALRSADVISRAKRIPGLWRGVEVLIRDLLEDFLVAGDFPFELLFCFCCTGEVLIALRPFDVRIGDKLILLTPGDLLAGDFPFDDRRADLARADTVLPGERLPGLRAGNFDRLRLGVGLRVFADCRLRLRCPKLFGPAICAW